MADPKRTREELARARDELRAAEAQLEAYESPEAREQRELGRADWAWRYLSQRLTPQLAAALARAAEAEGEGWLYEVEVLEADGHAVADGSGEALR